MSAAATAPPTAAAAFAAGSGTPVLSLTVMDGRRAEFSLEPAADNRRGAEMSVMPPPAGGSCRSGEEERATPCVDITSSLGAEMTVIDEWDITGGVDMPARVKICCRTDEERHRSFGDSARYALSLGASLWTLWPRTTVSSALLEMPPVPPCSLAEASCRSRGCCEGEAHRWVA